MRITLGYLKDAAAVVFFVVVLGYITVRAEPIPLAPLQVVLAMCILLDGLFTVVPRLHNMPVSGRPR